MKENKIYDIIIKLPSVLENKEIAFEAKNVSYKNMSMELEFSSKEVYNYLRDWYDAIWLSKLPKIYKGDIIGDISVTEIVYEQVRSVIKFNASQIFSIKINDGVVKCIFHYDYFTIDELRNKNMIEKYTSLGIDSKKIHITKLPCFKWSLSKKCVVAQDAVETADIIKDDNGNYRLSYENNINLTVKTYDKINAELLDKINKSLGIVVFLQDNGKFRFEFIPDKNEWFQKKETKNDVGYHLDNISKGELGSISKIEEEFLELKDAEAQKSKVMVLVELSDLYGAIEEYAKLQNVTMQDLKIFSDITKRAFKNGERK